MSDPDYRLPLLRLLLQRPCLLRLFLTILIPVLHSPNIAQAQTATNSPIPLAGKTSLTLGVSTGSAPAPYSEGKGTRLTLETELHSINVRTDLVSQQRFGLQGDFAGIQATGDLSPTRYISLGAGAGSSDLFARWNSNAFLYQKWGINSPHITGVGVVYSAMRDDRSETDLVGQQIWYARNDLILEGGLRIGRATPGAVASNQQFAATTLGLLNDRHAVLKLTRSHEAYQLLGNAQTLSQFASREANLTVYQPVTSDQWLTLALDRYINPYYARNQAELGWRLSW